MKLTVAATNGGYSLADLRAFIAACEHGKFADTAEVSARITMGGRVREMSVTHPQHLKNHTEGPHV